MALKQVPVRLIGLLVLGYVLYVVDLGAVLAQLRRIGPISVAAAAAAFVVLLFARCARWHLLVRCIAPQRSFATNFLSCNESIWLGMATPARVGEFGRGLDLARHGAVPLAEASALVVLDLLLDLFVYATLALAGVLLLLLRNHPVIAPLAYGACVLMACVCLARLRTLIGLVRRWFPSMARLRGVGILAALEPAPDDKSSLGIAATTMVAFLAYAAMIAALVAPMHLELAFLQTLSMIGLVGVSGAIPVTYFGFGTREVALIWYFGELGIGTETAVAVSFSFVIAQLVGIAVAVALSVSLRLVQRLGKQSK